MHMKFLKHLPTSLALSLVLVTGCKKDLRSDISSHAQLQTANTSAANQAAQLAVIKEKLEKLTASLPAGLQAKLAEGLPLVQHPEYRSAVLNALKVTDATACNDNTALNQWLDKQLS